MKEYIRPFIEDEEVEIEDVIAISAPKNDPFDMELLDPEGEDL